MGVPPCKIEDCGKPTKALGYCNSHYIRFKRHGDPLGGKPVFHGEPMKFIQGVVLNYSGEECLVWPFFRKADGRGQVRFRGSDQVASRVVCTLAHGEPPTPKHEAAHNCGKGHEGCVAPNHLRWATMLENEEDKRIHGTIKKGVEHHSSKLNQEQVRELISLRGTMTQIKLASAFNVSERTVRKVFYDNDNNRSAVAA